MVDVATSKTSMDKTEPYKCESNALPLTHMCDSFFNICKFNNMGFHNNLLRLRLANMIKLKTPPNEKMCV